MATLIFDGSVSGDISDTDNWSTGSLPTDSDHVLVIDPDHGMTDALDTLAAVTLASFRVFDTCRFPIGVSAGTPLEVSVSGILDFQSSAAMWIDGSLGNVQAKSARGSLNLDGTITAATLLRGEFSVETGAAITTLNLGHDGNSSNDVLLTIAAGVTLTTVNQAGGSVASESFPVTLRQTAGTWAQHGTGGTTTLLDGNSGKYALMEGGNTITTLANRGAHVFDASAIKIAATVTNCEHWIGAKIIRRSMGLLAFTNGVVIRGSGIPMIDVDSGAVISFA